MAMDNLQAQIYKGFFVANPIKDVFINPHAILRYKQRTGSTKGDVAIENKLRRALLRSYEVDIKERYRINALLNNNLVEARYFRHGDWILVVRGNELITVHEGLAGRWTRDPKLEERRNYIDFESFERKELKKQKTRQEYQEAFEDLGKEESETLFTNPANSHGQWGRWSLYEASIEGLRSMVIVKVKKAKKSGLKFFPKDKRILYVKLSEMRGADPKECKLSDLNWIVGMITNIEEGILFVSPTNEDPNKFLETGVES